MASDQKFVDYVCDQMRRAGGITTRRMFGEYAVYHHDKVIALVCDNQLFVRPTRAGEALLGRTPDAAPFPGAKPHFRLDEELEDHEALARLVVATARELPPPKPNSRAGKNTRPAEPKKSAIPRAARSTATSGAKPKPKTRTTRVRGR
jgi:TfoX/Sxy family transcriptional regulator of competence genes